MRKMKKVLSLAMTAAMTASLLTGMGAVTASAKKSDDGKRTKITALLKGTESTEQYKTFDYLLKNANVVGTPGSGFGSHGEGYFRLTAFGTYENTLKAIDRIKSL